jgi:hypothetical protein
MTRAQFWTWFTNSETILWARAQVIFGVVSGGLLIVWSVASSTDLSSLFANPKWFSVWLVTNGVITELLRKRGTLTRDGHLRDPDDDKTMNPGDVQEK